ncbi:MAG: PrgI family protein [Candidatus Pacebacteria bacterium]|nr:PrgI family protein [Candidatus Paceibacterota bacterium]
MRYQVPQFIEVEDKIFGPLTLKQFIYLAGGAGLSFVIWSLLPTYIALVLVGPVVALSVGLAFYKVNNRPLLNILEYAINYTLGNKLYLWESKKATPKKEAVAKEAGGAQTLSVPNLSESKLKDLAWSLDIKETINPATGSHNQTNV